MRFYCVNTSHTRGVVKIAIQNAASQLSLVLGDLTNQSDTATIQSARWVLGSVKAT
jgi:hypothetical protein